MLWNRNPEKVTTIRAREGVSSFDEGDRLVRMARTDIHTISLIGLGR